MRVEPARLVDVAARTKFLVQDRLHLEHVSEVIGTRKAQGAVIVERHVIETHVLAQVTREGARHLRAAQDFTGNAGPPADEALPAAEDTERTAADVFGGDAGQSPTPERQ